MNTFNYYADSLVSLLFFCVVVWCLWLAILECFYPSLPEEKYGRQIERPAEFDRKEDAEMMGEPESWGNG